MPRSVRSFTLAALALAGLLAPALAGATQILLQTVEQMTMRSDVVVRAVPIPGRAESHWTNPDGTGLIVTTTRLRVLESYQGDAAAGQEIVVEHYGGRVGDISMAIPGMTAFLPGEEVV